MVRRRSVCEGTVLSPEGRPTDEPHRLGFDAAMNEQGVDPADPYPPGSAESERWQVGLKDGRFQVRVWNGSE